ncbi:MAG: sugar ABC transporter substrate-binding protein [Clostridia bacterium]|nr:sugar ABC transporter substrate-binding protein [Clostridia bacterium]
MDIKRISAKLNISSSAVRKAIGHKRGVDVQVREEIFALLGKDAPCAKPGDKPSIGVVLPSNPQFFWDDVYRGIKSAIPESFDVHFAFFSSLGSGHEGVHAIDFVRNLDICIIAPSVAPVVQAKIAELSAEKPIVYVNDGLATPQVATICGNYYDDGLLLGRAYAEVFSESKRLLSLHVHNGLGAQMRTNGFKKAITDAGCEIVGNIDLEEITSSFASVIARQLHSQFNDKFDCLYCATGATPHAALALNKLKSDKDIFCIGYENPKSNAPYIENGTVQLLSIRNAYRMGQVAGQTAVDFAGGLLPQNKTIYVPSEIYINQKGILTKKMP